VRVSGVWRGAMLAIALTLALALGGCRAQRAADLADLGRQALEQGDHRAAVVAFQHSVDLKPSADAYLGLGIAYDLKGDVDQALENLSLAIVMNNSSAEAYYWRGSLLGSQGDYARALADFSQAIALDPAHAAAYLSRGATFIELGSYGRAREDLLRAHALTVDPALRAQIEATLQAIAE